MRLHQRQLDDVTDADGRDQPQHDRFKVAEILALQAEHDQRIECGQQHAGGQRTFEEQMESQRAAEHFGQIAGHDRQFGKQPLKTRHTR